MSIARFPVEVLREAWIAGTNERRSHLTKESQERKNLRPPEALWAEQEAEYVASMEACARVIEKFLSKGKKK